MSGQNFDEINQILNDLKQNTRSTNNHYKYSSSEPKKNHTCKKKISNCKNEQINKDCNGNVKILGELYVCNNAEVQCDLTVCNNVCIDNELQVNKISSNSNTSVCINSILQVNEIEPKEEKHVRINNLCVENITFKNTDPTCDSGNINGDVNMNDNLYVAGTITSCSGINTKNLTVGGNLTLCNKLKVPNFEVCGDTILGGEYDSESNPHKTQVNGNLCVSNCVTSNAFIGAVKCITLDNDSSNVTNVKNYTTLIVQNDGDTIENTLELQGSVEGQILVLINETDANVDVDDVNIESKNSRVIVYYNGSWH